MIIEQRLQEYFQEIVDIVPFFDLNVKMRQGSGTPGALHYNYVLSGFVGELFDCGTENGLYNSA